MAEMTAADAVKLLKEFYPWDEDSEEDMNQIAAIIEQQAQEIEQARATIDTHSELVEHYKQRAEQAEASCAAMRLKFEQYARNKCKLIAQFSGKLGKPIIESGKCQGYAMSEHDDEPHYFCQECPACLHNDDDEQDAGFALLAELQRYREALREISGKTMSTCLNYKEMATEAKRIAQAALEGLRDKEVNQ